MKERIQFRQKVQAILSQIDPEYLAYDESEFWMIQTPYEYIEFYAQHRHLLNTSIALPLARGLHNGTHRKSSLLKHGVAYRLPYVIHCLQVCRILMYLDLPLPDDELDVLLAAALCHDMIEDIPFPEGGRELTTKFHLDPRVYETVRLVSKRKDFTLEEEQAFFHGIESNRLALLVKLADRGHNVEDLFNRSVWKVHEYVGETRTYYMPMCDYGLAHYPELQNAIGVLQGKMNSLTSVSEILVDRCEAREQELTKRLQALKEENAQLRAAYAALWKE